MTRPTTSIGFTPILLLLLATGCVAPVGPGSAAPEADPALGKADSTGDARNGQASTLITLRADNGRLVEVVQGNLLELVLDARPDLGDDYAGILHTKACKRSYACAWDYHDGRESGLGVPEVSEDGSRVRMFWDTTDAIVGRRYTVEAAYGPTSGAHAGEVYLLFHADVEILSAGAEDGNCQLRCQGVLYACASEAPEACNVDRAYEIFGSVPRCAVRAGEVGLEVEWRSPDDYNAAVECLALDF